jgi:RNA polymerase sigma-70 factor, ECF subfamily
MTFFKTSPRAAQASLVPAENFARFYEQAHLSVFRYVMVLCAGDTAEAEEITAGAFLRAWEKRQQFAGSASAALGWVITIARNLLIDRRRSAALHPLEPLPEEDLPGPAGNIEDILVDGEQLQRVLAAVQSLPFPQRNMLTLRYALGWRVKDIAGHLSLPENTVSVDLRRALARLQKELAPKNSAERAN